MGRTVKLMAPQFFKPYVKSNKNNAADAEAICEAVGRPTMRFVPIENAEQRSVLALHRARQGFVRLLIDRLLEHLKALRRQVDEIEAQIKAWQCSSEASRRLEKVPGIGPLTASALAAIVGDAKNFDNGRQLAAWLEQVACTN